MKTTYFSMTTHPNMNYDRSLRSIIWAEFPKLYRLYLNYMQAHPQLRSHMQLPPQTLLSLKQCAPDVIEQAQALRAAGQLRYMGTFFSESIAQCQDGMSVLDAAELGCGIASAEMDAELEGFFLQEVAYTSQLPYMINKVGVQWTIIRDWDDPVMPFRAEGLDGSRCVAVPLCEDSLRRRIMETPDILPDNALLITHCDMEIPRAIKVMHELQQFLDATGRFETKWCFVSDYIAEVGVEALKHPTPCTNKPQGKTDSPSMTRWCGDPLSMQVHKATLEAMEARRAACLISFGRASTPPALPQIPATRPDTTWEVENPWIYPELVRDFAASAGADVSPCRRLAMLIAWGCNSDGRGWYPMLERRWERRDSFAEAEMLADALIRDVLTTPDGGAALVAVNPHSTPVATWHTVPAAEPLAFVDNAGTDVVQHIRRRGTQWEHLLRTALPSLSLASFARRPTTRKPLSEHEGTTISNQAMTLAFRDGVLGMTAASGARMHLALDPFRICLKSIDTELRDLEPEGDWRVCVVAGDYPRLIARRQIDYHIHYQAEYTLDGDRLFADWRFVFTYPTLVDALDDFDAGGPKTDFEPGGICASLSTDHAGEVWYDVPFGVVQHPNPDASFVPPLTHAFLDRPNGGVAMVSQEGSQSFRVEGSAGRLGLCMGRSITSGGRRRLQHWSGESIDEFGCDTDWYKEIFHGELRHRFVVQPFSGSWQANNIPSVCRALAHGPRMLSSETAPTVSRRIATLSPDHVRLAGLEPDTGRIVLCEMAGRDADYSLDIAGSQLTGRIKPFQILELTP